MWSHVCIQLNLFLSDFPVQRRLDGRCLRPGFILVNGNRWFAQHSKLWRPAWILNREHAQLEWSAYVQWMQSVSRWTKVLIQCVRQWLVQWQFGLVSGCQGFGAGAFTKMMNFLEMGSALKPWSYALMLIFSEFTIFQRCSTRFGFFQFMFAITIKHRYGNTADWSREEGNYAIEKKYPK